MIEADIRYRPIGVIHSDHLIEEQTPIQPACASGCKGRAEIFPDIKPYTAKFDRIDATRNGWQDEVDEETARRRGKRGHTG